MLPFYLFAKLAKTLCNTLRPYDPDPHVDREKKVKFMLYTMQAKIYVEVYPSLKKKRLFAFENSTSKVFLYVISVNVFLLFLQKALGLGPCKLYVNPFVLYINKK